MLHVSKFGAFQCPGANSVVMKLHVQWTVLLCFYCVELVLVQGYYLRKDFENRLFDANIIRNIVGVSRLPQMCHRLRNDAPVGHISEHREPEMPQIRGDMSEKF